MTKPNDAVFPTMTKRELFSVLAMSALILHVEKREDFTAKLPPDAISRMAIAQADALIAELNKESK